MQPLKVQRSPLGLSNTFNSQKPYRAYFEENSSLDQGNIKELHFIQAKTRQLREKEKRERDILKKFRKIFEDQVKKFQQLQKVSNQALQQKSRQLELLSIENTQLKEERVELQAVKEEKQLLNLKYEQLEKQNASINAQIAEMTEKYDQLKVDFDQKSELLQNGIQNNKIQTEQSSLKNIPGSMKEVEQLNNQLQEQKRKQIEQAIAKEEEKLASKSLEISNILETFLQSVPNQSGISSENKTIETGTANDQTKLELLSEELKRKSQQISRVIINSHQLKISLRDRETEILRLSLNLKDHQKKLQDKNNSILALKKELQSLDEKEANRIKAEEIKRDNKMKSYQKFQQDLIELVKAKTLEQYKNFYDLMIGAYSQIFTAFKSSFTQGSTTDEKFIESIMKIADLNMIYLNDFFTDISKKQNQKLTKMSQYFRNAKNISDKRYEFEQQSDLERDLLSQSTPDRFGFTPSYQHKRQESGQSLKSQHKRSVLLSHEMGSANNYEEFMEHLKDEAFQQQHDLTMSQIILDTLKEGSSIDDSAVQDGFSDSISKSQISNISQADQNRAHNEKKKTIILNAKLKKKKKN